MTDAYRTAAFTCPVCSNATLREFHDRLVCDECNGMLIGLDDIAASIHELDGSNDKLDITDDKPGDKRCPRCTHALAPCTVKLGSPAAQPMKVHGAFLHCAAHGLWFPRDAMTALFARVSRRGGFRGMGAVAGATGGGGGGGTSGNDASVIGNMPSAHSGMSSAMASIASAFRAGTPASSGLAISHWEHHKPRVHTLFVSAHKDRRLGCPSCKETALAYQGDRWACSTCAGAFVENAALAAMIEEMAQKPWDVPAVSGAPGERACPICKTAMLVEVLEAVTIDRCGQHGVWFDDTELQTALHHASAAPSGIGSWLKQLFHRHGSTE